MDRIDSCFKRFQTGGVAGDVAQNPQASEQPESGTDDNQSRLPRGPKAF